MPTCCARRSTAPSATEAAEAAALGGSRRKRAELPPVRGPRRGGSLASRLRHRSGRGQRHRLRSGLRTLQVAEQRCGLPGGRRSGRRAPELEFRHRGPRAVRGRPGTRAPRAGDRRRLPTTVQRQELQLAGGVHRHRPGSDEHHHRPAEPAAEAGRDRRGRRFANPTRAFQGHAWCDARSWIKGRTTRWPSTPTRWGRCWATCPWSPGSSSDHGLHRPATMVSGR